MLSPRRFAKLLPLTAASVLMLFPAARARAAEECFSCHASVDNVGDDQLVVSSTLWQSTVHGKNGVACVDCHAGHDQYPHRASEPRAACANCHQDVIDMLAASIHKGGEKLLPPRPGCETCHGTVHTMLPTADPASKVNPRNLPATCGSCHANPGLSGDVDVRFVQPIAAYSHSVHARAIANGEKAATCSSCHGSHDILPGSDPRSSVAKRNVPATCGQCHTEIAKTFAESVHGKAAAIGIDEAPVCTDCHGEHRILGPPIRVRPSSRRISPR